MRMRHRMQDMSRPPVTMAGCHDTGLFHSGHRAAYSVRTNPQQTGRCGGVASYMKESILWYFATQLIQTNSLMKNFKIEVSRCIHSCLLVYSKRRALFNIIHSFYFEWVPIFTSYQNTIINQFISVWWLAKYQSIFCPLVDKTAIRDRKMKSINGMWCKNILCYFANDTLWKIVLIRSQKWSTVWCISIFTMNQFQFAK